MSKPKIYTSYYAKLDKFNPNDFIRIQISRGCPVADKMNISWDELMPSWDLLKRSKDGLITNEEYTIEYEKQLEQVTFERISTVLNKILMTDKDIVLFCYESPEKFCHRHILANWYNKKANEIIITEYENL